MSRLNNHSNDSVETHFIYRGIVTYNMRHHNIMHCLENKRKRLNGGALHTLTRTPNVPKRRIMTELERI